MRFFNILAILAVASASTEVANLRGSEVDTNEDRDLLAVGVIGGSVSYSKSCSFSFNCCHSLNDCFDPHAWCLAYSSTDADTKTAGNGAAESAFLAAALCGALAEAHSCAFACVKAKGSIDLNAKSSTKYGMDFNLKMKLKSATCTVAKASTAAAAAAATGVAGVVYTTTDTDFCKGPGKDHPSCNNGGATAVAEIGALSFGDALAVSDAVGASGTSSAFAAWVDAAGPSISEVSAFVTSIAESWSFAAASSSAFAESLAAAAGAAAAISKQCDKAYNDHCSSGGCGYPDKQSACNAAIAFASGEALAYSTACANASTAAFAATKICINFGGKISGFPNDGKPMTLGFASGQTYASGSAAAICPRYK